MVNFDTFLLTHRSVNLNAHANTNWIICSLIVDEMETQYASPKWFQDSIFNNSRAIPISKKNLSKTKQITDENKARTIVWFYLQPNYFDKEKQNTSVL